MRGKPTIAESLALGLLELSPTPLSADVLALNFNVDADRVEDVLREAEADGLIDHVGGGFYEISDAGREQVELRCSRSTPTAMCD